MPGIRDRSLRSGNIHEELGVLLLRPIALVAPVPLWEDVGLDAVATLLRPEGGRRLIPEDAFGVQLKATSERVISYCDRPGESAGAAGGEAATRRFKRRRGRGRWLVGDAARWVTNLGLPFFIGSVRLEGAAIDLYPTHALYKVRPHAGLKEVHLHLDGHPEHFGTPEVAHIYIGPPAFSWSADHLADREFPARVYPVLKGHIQKAQHSIQGRAIGHFEPVVWEPGRPPELSGAVMLQGDAGRDASDILASLVAPIRALLLEFRRPDRLVHLPAVLSSSRRCEPWGPIRTWKTVL